MLRLIDDDTPLGGDEVVFQMPSGEWAVELIYQSAYIVGFPSREDAELVRRALEKTDEDSSRNAGLSDYSR